MKTLRYISWRGLSFILLLLAVGCGDDNEENGGKSTFLIVSEKLGYVRPVKQHSVNVPFAGGTYQMTVKATDDVQWSVSVIEGDDFVTVSPIGNQSGNGVVTVTVKANSDKVVKMAKLSISNSLDNVPAIITLKQVEKKLYIPAGSQGQSVADFEKEASQYNKRYMVEGNNVAIFWDRAMGRDPLQHQYSFDKNKLLTACEEVYAFLTNQLNFASSPNSYGNQYKLLVFVENKASGTAYGGGDNNVGKLWLTPGRINENENYLIIYHEMCHSLQYIAEFDGAAPLRGYQGGSVYEMTSQWALLRRYPDWGVNQESGHFKDYINQTHLAIGHEENAYHNPFMLEYWTNKHGEDFIGRMWQNSTADDEGIYIKTYMRLTNTNQDAFNAEVYDAAAHFINWDLSHIHDSYAQHGGTNIHECELKKVSGNYRISNMVNDYSPKGRCPQNYGYNGIKLKIPTSTSEVSIKFRGLTKAGGFNVKYPENAEWRFGFVAIKKDGTVDYGKSTVAGTNQLTASYNVPTDTSHLWLVVAATPKTFIKTVDNEWPYEFSLTGTEPDGDKCKVK